jgi:hypothetical protein
MDSEVTRMTDRPVALPAEMSPASKEHSVSFPGDRRRPGRVQNVNPALIPLLRSGEITKIQMDEDDQEPMRASRGIAIGLLLVAPFWIGIGALLMWFRRR